MLEVVSDLLPELLDRVIPAGRLTHEGGKLLEVVSQLLVLLKVLKALKLSLVNKAPLEVFQLCLNPLLVNRVISTHRTRSLLASSLGGL